jgi:hypothetical protein
MLGSLPLRAYRLVARLIVRSIVLSCCKTETVEKLYGKTWETKGQARMPQRMALGRLPEKRISRSWAQRRGSGHLRSSQPETAEIDLAFAVNH